MKHHIDEHWAKHPRTQMHLNFIFEAAKKDRRFQNFIEQLINEGICTPDGKLLMKYSGGGFQKV